MSNTAEAKSERTSQPAPKRLRAVSSKPGRPTAKRVEAINEIILASARKHFLSEGYDRTSIDDIAATARVSKSTLYGRYQTKDALRLAVVVAELDHFHALAEQRSEPKSTDLKRCLQRQARVMSAALMSPESRALDRLVGDSRHDGGELAKILHARHQQIMSDVARDISERARDFVISPQAAARVAEVLFTSLIGWDAVRKVSGAPSAEEARRYADDLVDIIWAGRGDW